MRIHRIKRNLRLKLQLSAALLVAGLFSLRKPREAWPRIRGAFKTWVRWRQDETPAPFWVYVRRVRQCHRCPIFSPVLRTCGSPIFAPKEARALGCFCSCIHKASIISADCWLRSQGIDDAGGWPDNLRWLSTDVERVQPRNCGSCRQESK